MRFILFGRKMHPGRVFYDNPSDLTLNIWRLNTAISVCCRVLKTYGGNSVTGSLCFSKPVPFELLSSHLPSRIELCDFRSHLGHTLSYKHTHTHFRLLLPYCSSVFWFSDYSLQKHINFDIILLLMSKYVNMF